jgi:hypothetical protein
VISASITSTEAESTACCCANGIQNQSHSILFRDIRCVGDVCAIIVVVVDHRRIDRDRITSNAKKPTRLSSEQRIGHDHDNDTFCEFRIFTSDATPTLSKSKRSPFKPRIIRRYSIHSGVVAARTDCTVDDDVALAPILASTTAQPTTAVANFVTIQHHENRDQSGKHDNRFKTNQPRDGAARCETASTSRSWPPPSWMSSSMTTTARRCAVAMPTPHASHNATESTTKNIENLFIRHDEGIGHRPAGQRRVDAAARSSRAR